MAAYKAYYTYIWSENICLDINMINEAYISHPWFFVGQKKNKRNSYVKPWENVGLRKKIVNPWNFVGQQKTKRKQTVNPWKNVGHEKEIRIIRFLFEWSGIGIYWTDFSFFIKIHVYKEFSKIWVGPHIFTRPPSLWRQFDGGFYSGTVL